MSPDEELRRAQRASMTRIEERLGLSFSQGDIEMRAKPDGTGGSAYEWDGYASVYSAPFQMYDRLGDPFMESVAPGACKRSLANPNLDVPFVFGHSEWGIPFARTSAKTMHLSEDSHGLHVHVPAMDGRREDVRALASAVERGDVNEMSLAFVCNRQEWDAGYENRTVAEMDLHRGDVSAVIHGANPATAGVWMSQVEQLRFRRPAAIGGPVLLERGAVTQDDRDKAKAAGNSLPDGSYPINNVAQLHSAAVLAASHHGDWKAAQALIRRRAKELGVDVSTLPGFGEEHASGAPYELRASAASDIDSATAPDYDPAATDHPQAVACKTCKGSGSLPHPVTGGDGAVCPSCNGTGAVIEVDDSTGIPGEEQSLSAARRLELRLRELELDELARPTARTA